VQELLVIEFVYTSLATPPDKVARRAANYIISSLSLWEKQLHHLFSLPLGEEG
jgi:hypothetical protein